MTHARVRREGPMRRVRVAAVAILACVVISRLRPRASPRSAPRRRSSCCSLPTSHGRTSIPTPRPRSHSWQKRVRLGVLRARWCRPGEVPDDLRGAAVMSAGQHVPAPTADMSDAYPVRPAREASWMRVDRPRQSAAGPVDRRGRRAKPFGGVCHRHGCHSRVGLARIGEECCARRRSPPWNHRDLDAYRRLLASLGRRTRAAARAPRSWCSILAMEPGPRGGGERRFVESLRRLRCTDRRGRPDRTREPA